MDRTDPHSRQIPNRQHRHDRPPDRKPYRHGQGLLRSPYRRGENPSSRRARELVGFSLNLIRTAWIRSSDRKNVFITARKSMTIRTYIHSSHKRVESSALLDCGATENFMSMDYAKWLHLPIKRLQAPRPLFNVDGTTNRKGDLLFYSDLKMKTGSIAKTMRFFLTNLGHHRIILGYPWFVANQPRIDWAKGWIDASHLPVIISPPDLPTYRFPLRPTNHELR